MGMEDNTWASEKEGGSSCGPVLGESAGPGGGPDCHSVPPIVGKKEGGTVVCYPPTAKEGRGGGTARRKKKKSSPERSVL